MKVFVSVVMAGCLWMGGNLLIANPAQSQNPEVQTYPACNTFTTHIDIPAFNFSCQPPVNGKCSGTWADAYAITSRCGGTNGSANATCVDGNATQSDPVSGFQPQGYCFAVTSQGQTFCMPSDSTSTGNFSYSGPNIPKCHTVSS